ncbi:MAG: hypothetical protein M1827_002104 [Pycnora praestabilis]|nr:MAG: hypothetical protein M1827_002104 [Pycnora praestabilis]
MQSELPDEVQLGILNEQYPCRELQIRQLAYLLHVRSIVFPLRLVAKLKKPILPIPSILVIYGLEATGKSSIVKDVLDTIGTPHAIIKSQECITVRHMLERAVAACADVVVASSEDAFDRLTYGRCENISVLVVQLQRLLQGTGRFILVFDGIDRQREAPPTLLPALARMGEIIPNLSIALIVTAPRPRFLHSTGIPHIHFTPYTRDQSLTILSARPRSIFEDNSPSPSSGYTDLQAAEDSAWVWTRFCSVVWDSLARGAARDLVSFRSVAHKLWKPFVAPIVEGLYGTRDFSRLMVKKRGLFQSEVVLVDGVVPKDVVEGSRTALRISHDLPYYSKYLLCAAYLASYNPARQDPIFFMKASEKKRRKKGGGTTVGRVAKHRKIQRHLLGPQVFVMERMLAIFHAILPHTIIPTADIQTQIATLASLRLLVRTSTAADVLEAQTKWRVNVGGEYIHQLARSVCFEIENHLAE